MKLLVILTILNINFIGGRVNSFIIFYFLNISTSHETIKYEMLVINELFSSFGVLLLAHLNKLPS